MYLSVTIKEIIKRIPKRLVSTFFFTMLVAMVAHLPVLTNVLNNYDSLQPYGAGVGVASGRWLLTVLEGIVRRYWGDYNILLFNNLIAIILFAVCATLIVYLFQIKDGLLSFLVGGIFITFPTITCTLFFFYTSGYYGLAVLLAVLSVLLVNKFNGVISVMIASFLLACSMGIYQAYFPFASSLLLLLLIKICFENPSDLKNNIICGIKYLSMLLLSLLLYFIIQELARRHYNVTLFDYQGISEMGKVNAAQLPALIQKTYQIFFKLPFENYCQVNYSFVVRAGILMLGISSVFLLFYNLQKKTVQLKIKVLFLLLIFPIALNSIVIMAPKGSIYSLMVLSLSVIYLIPVYFLDYANSEWIKRNDSKKNRSYYLLKITNLVVPAVMSVIILNYIWGANGNYTAMFYMNQQTTSYMNEFVTKMKSADGYKTGMQVAIIGQNINDPEFKNIWENTPFLWGGNPAELRNAYSRNQYIRVYTGYTLPEIPESELNAYKNNPTVKAMPNYPNDGSIAVVDGVLVVKLSE